MLRSHVISPDCFRRVGAITQTMSSSTNNHPAAYLAASGDADGQALHEAPNGRAEASIRDSPQPRGAAIATSPI